MAKEEKKAHSMDDIIIEQTADVRHPKGVTAKVLMTILVLWSVFQLWVASPLPFSLGIWISDQFSALASVFDGLLLDKFFNFFARIFDPLNGTEVRSIHLAFAMLLAFMVYPLSKKSPKDKIPVADIIFALVGTYCASYLFIYYEDIANRPGLPTQQDVTVAVIGIVLLLEATRRSLGPPLMIVAAVFLFYTFFGSAEWMPDVISHKGQSFEKIASHQWLTTEGVFGIAVGVSASFVFLFVLFGALLEKAGAGNYFIKVAFALLGHLRGGPAKAAVLSSGMTGLISGSSIANVVTTGTFTVPLMKRVGFSSEKAGAVEVGSSVNGQIMPPVMGAAAFLMAEYVGIPYIAVIKHAFLPALISYLALLYIVHLEAVKADMPVLEKVVESSWFQRIFFWGIVICSLLILAGASYFIIEFVKDYFVQNSVYVLSGILGVVYIALLWYQSRYPDLEIDDPNSPVVKLPELGPTIKTGFHYLLPIVVLVWCLMKERLSPGLSAFWGSVFMIFIILTQKPLLAFFRKNKNLTSAVKQGILDLKEGLADGAKNMIGIGVATAAAGIIVGTVSLTGIGQIMTELIELVSGGSILLVLLFTGLICLVLGMGLPTTANYIVVSSLMVNVIMDLGMQNGFVFPAIAVHLFVFYFGIMADVTPPVGLASFAAAAVSGGDPIKTGFQAFFYSLRTIILPFLFLFNTELLMIGVDGVLEGIFVFIIAMTAMLVFAAATQGYFITNNKLYESALMLLVAFTLFRPGYWMDRISPPYKEESIKQIEQIVGELPVGSEFRVSTTGENMQGKIESLVLAFPVKEGETGAERLEKLGLILRFENNKPVVDDLVFNSIADKAGMDYDYVIEKMEIPQPQPAKEWMFIPGFALLLIIGFMQKARKPADKKKKLAAA